MKAFILSCFSRPRRLTALIVLLIGSMTPPAVAHRLAAQTVSWTSSDPAVATVDANGTVTPLSNGTATITAAITQNGKTVTSGKTVGVSLQYPGCNVPDVYVNGVRWAGCNVGGSTATGKGTFTVQTQAETCATGWRRALTNDYWLLDKASGGSCGSFPSLSTNCGGGVWGSLSGVSGRWFSGNGTKSATGLFFPANGTGDTAFTYYTTNVIMTAGLKEICCSGQIAYCYNDLTVFRSSGSYPNAYWSDTGGDYEYRACKLYGGSVRCIKTEE